MRRYLIAGNWKMHKGPVATGEFMEGLLQKMEDIPNKVDVLVCPPFVSLETAQNRNESDGIFMGAQNLHFEDEGAFTGEISAGMLTELNCDYVIIGHSERREFFAETDRTVNLKVKKALQHEIKPIICVGESLRQRKAGEHVTLVRKQVHAAFNEINREKIENAVIAYEPVWAIGTGETATPRQAQEMHRMIRDEIEKLYDSSTAGNIRILYGGSMKPHNAQELLEQSDVDGGLIGGASLEVKSFVSIIQTAVELS